MMFYRRGVLHNKAYDSSGDVRLRPERSRNSPVVAFRGCKTLEMENKAVMHQLSFARPHCCRQPATWQLVTRRLHRSANGVGHVREHSGILPWRKAPMFDAIQRMASPGMKPGSGSYTGENWLQATCRLQAGRSHRITFQRSASIGARRRAAFLRSTCTRRRRSFSIVAVSRRQLVAFVR